MDSPVSAFAVYSQNPPKKKKVVTNKTKSRNKKSKHNKIGELRHILKNGLSMRKPQGTPIKNESIKDTLISEIMKRNVSMKQNDKTPKLIKLTSKKSKDWGKPAIDANSSTTLLYKKTKVLKNNEVSKKAEVSEKNRVSNKSEVPKKAKVLLKPPKATELEQHDDHEIEFAGCSSSEEYEQLESIHSNESFDFEPVTTDSRVEGKRVFEWLISPCKVDRFFKEIWEKRPFHIKRNNEKYFKNLISTPKIDNMLRTENIQFTKNIDITSYDGKRRETHNPVGRAHPHVVWDYYLNGCSIRLLNPQTYMQHLHLLNATMQEYFNSFVGANAYLTPPDSQGFAPHYDDIEAFVLQVEGKKLWKVYKPLSEDDTLPRVSSKNFDQSEIGEPIMEVTLEAGDLLYFPRGYIHQGITINGEHSLHVTVSFYQRHSWADLFEKMLHASLDTAISRSVELRRGLPLDIYDHLGLIHSELETPDPPRRVEIIKDIKKMFNKVIDNLAFDFAADEMCKKFQHDALPPVLTASEMDCTVFGESDRMIKNGNVINRVELEPDTKIRLLRRNILRMVMEDEGIIRLYFNIENSLEYHGNEPQYMEVDADTAPAVESLLHAYPNYIKIDSLGLENVSDSVAVAASLWEKGLIMTEYPMPTLE